MSGRERQCLVLLAGGHGAKGIAFRLGLARRTVEHHIESARRKLCARNAAHAVALALVQRLI